MQIIQIIVNTSARSFFSGAKEDRHFHQTRIKKRISPPEKADGDASSVLIRSCFRGQVIRCLKEGKNVSSAMGARGNLYGECVQRYLVEVVVELLQRS